MGERADVTFHAPPGWPAMPDGFTPDEGWEPAAHWGLAPAGWTFYTRNGQPVPPPPGRWRPGPESIAQRSAGDPLLASTQSRASGRAGSVRRSNSPIALIAGVAFLGLAVAAVFVTGLVRERIAASAAEPLSGQQLITALDAGQAVDGMKLTSVEETDAESALGGHVCTDALLIYGVGVPVVTASGGGLGVDPTTGKIIEGGLVNITAVNLTTTAEAKASFTASADEFGRCLVSRLSSYTQESAAENYQTTRTEEDSRNYIVMTHRNVIALIQTDSERAKRAGELVEDVESLLDQARTS